MLRHKGYLTGSLIAVLMVLGACRAPAPKSTGIAPPDAPITTPTTPGDPTRTQEPSAPAPTQAAVAATQTPSQPTTTPFPTLRAEPTATAWPMRWEPTGGPQGGFIETLAIDPRDPDTLYAAGAGGSVYVSHDGGESWLPGERLVAPSCPFTDLIVDAVAEGAVYVASSCAGVFKSSDAGASWAHAGAAIAGGVTHLVQSPHAPGLLLASGDDGRVYRSWDGAVTWESMSDGMPNEPVSDLAASDPNTYWATTTNGESGSLYRFSDGVWWVVPFGQPPGTTATGILVDGQDPSILFLGLKNTHNGIPDPASHYMFRSIDGGYSWSPAQSSPASGDALESGAQADAPVHILGQGRHAGTLYIAWGDELLSSADGGETWQPFALPRDLWTVSALRRITVDPTDDAVLYLPMRGTGILKSTDGGRTWRAVNQGLNNLIIDIIRPHPTDPSTLYTVPVGGTGIYASTAYGEGWARLGRDGLDRWDSGRIDGLIVDPNRPETLYQVIDGARVYHTADGGGTWSPSWPAFRFSAIYSLAIAPSAPDIVYANKGGSGLYRSDDGGNTWRYLPGSGADFTAALAIHPQTPDFVLSGESRKPYETRAELHRSKDGGNSWDVALTVPDGVGITSVAFDPRVEPVFGRGGPPADPTRLYAASTGPRGTLWFSNDAGDTWKDLNDAFNFTNVYALTVAPHRPGVAYASVRGGGTWRTENGGQTWQRLPGDPATSAVAVAVDPNNHNIIYIADATTPHLYRSTDDGNHWELLFDAGAGFDQLAALAMAPSDPSVLYVSAIRTENGAVSGVVFRVDAQAPNGKNATDITNNLPAPPISLAVHQRDHRRVFAALYGPGVWKTVDDGASWRQVKGGLPETGFYQIAVDPVLHETLFLAGGHDLRSETGAPAELNPEEAHGIWKSTDDGNNWTKVGDASLGRLSGPLNALSFHPQDERVMFAAGEGGVYLSPDRGETWTGINGRLPSLPMNGVATDGQTLFAGSAGGGVFAGAIHPLIHTADWVRESHLAVPVSDARITLHPTDPQTLFASAYPGGVFVTPDGGASWRARDVGLPSFAVADPSRQGSYALAIAPAAPEVVYVGMYDQGVFRSVDGAATWRPAHGEADEMRGATVQALLVHPTDPDVLYVSTEEGVWRTVNGGRSWAEFNTGLPPGGGIRTLGVGADDQLYAGSGGYGLYTRHAFHQGGEEAWRQLPELGHGLDAPRAARDLPYVRDWRDRRSRTGQYATLLVHPSDSNILYAGSYPAGVFKTSDGGAVWREQNVGFERAGVLSLIFHPDDAQTVYAGTTDGVARSTDGGATWHPWDAGWPPRQWVTSIAVDPTNPDRLYACSRNGGEDGNNDTPPGGTVMRSNDGGATWSEIALGLDVKQAFYQVLVDRLDPRVLYLASEREGVYISRDGGDSWSTWNEGLWSRVAGGDGWGLTDVLQLSADGRLLYFGSAGAGVWRRPAEGVQE